jgi:BASS family bile acid:Na+ symporter
MRIVSIVIFVAVILGIILANKNTIVFHLKNIGPVLLSLNILTMLLGFYSAKALKLNFKQCISISIESGMQNATLAIVIAATLLKNPLIGVPAAAYALLMYFTGGFIMWKFGTRKI